MIPVLREKKRQIILSTEPVNGTNNWVRTRLVVNLLDWDWVKVDTLMEYDSVMEIDWEDKDRKYTWINREDGLVFEGMVVGILKIIGLDSNRLYSMIEEIWEAKKPLELEDSYTAEIIY